MSRRSWSSHREELPMSTTPGTVTNQNRRLVTGDSFIKSVARCGLTTQTCAHGTPAACLVLNTEQPQDTIENELFSTLGGQPIPPWNRYSLIGDHQRTSQPCTERYSWPIACQMHVKKRPGSSCKKEGVNFSQFNDDTRATTGKKRRWRSWDSARIGSVNDAWLCACQIETASAPTTVF